MQSGLAQRLALDGMRHRAGYVVCGSSNAGFGCRGLFVDVDNRMAGGCGYADDFCWLPFVWIGFRSQQGGFLIRLCGWLWMGFERILTWMGDGNNIRAG